MSNVSFTLNIWLNLNVCYKFIRQHKFLCRFADEALVAHELAHQKMMQQNMKHTKPFKQGQKVWLESQNLHIPYVS